MIVSGFFRCACGKVHCYSGLNFGSVCTCKRNLRDQAFPPLAPLPKPAKKVDLFEVARKCAAELAKRQGLR